MVQSVSHSIPQETEIELGIRERAMQDERGREKHGDP